MKKTFFRIFVSVIVFVISLIIVSRIMNRGNTDLTQDMADATLPVIYMNVNNGYINALHGYTSDMEGAFLRGNITPINADRTVDIRVDTYGYAVARVAYEIRSLDCKRLIEDTELESFSFENDSINVRLSFKDLMDEDKEYMLVIKLITGEGNVVKYYSRIINTSEIYLTEKLDYVMDFSDKAFREDTAVELKKYMEPNFEGDNSSYGYVNIHSNFNQLHYGRLEPELISEKQLNIISIDAKEACIELSFRVKIKDDQYDVKEFFRISRGNERMYLMEYERTMNQIIDDEGDILVNGKIINGIVNEPIKLSESSNATIVSFVQQKSMYSFNTSNGQLVKVFSFRNGGMDARRDYDSHDIKILSTDESGNSYFIVYGYLNRGLHEGQMGITLYYYDSVLNTIEEVIFIPYSKSYEILKTDVEQLSYINARNQFYLFLDGSIYSINLESKEITTIASNLDENKFVSSKDNSVIAWQAGDSLIDNTSIQYYALDALSPSIVEGMGYIIQPLGFIENDLVYGVVRNADITTDSAGRTIVPMNKIVIENIKGDKLLEYSKENIYMLDVDITEEMIVLTRLTKDDEGRLTYTDNDEILNNSAEISGKNKYTSVITEEMETTHQIVLNRVGSFDQVKKLTPKEVIYEENRTISLEYKDTAARYYVHARGNIEGIYTDPLAAVISASEKYGVVVDKKDAYIFESGNRKGSNRIETVGDLFLTEDQMNNGITPLAACLNEMLEYNDVYKDIDTLLTGSNTVLSVLNENIGGVVLDLTGCTLDNVLYYVGRGFPVLAMTDAGKAVLIVGYDAKNTVLYNPERTEIYKLGMNDSRAFFEGYQNRFVTYVK